MNAWKVILATVAIFAMGMVTGTFTAKRIAPVPVDSKPAAQEVTNRFRPDSRHMRAFLKKAREELDLTDEQRAKVEQIIQESQQRSRAIWEEVAPRLHDEFKAAQEQICKDLTPAQRERFRELMKQRHAPESKQNRSHDEPNKDKSTGDHPPQANDCLPCPSTPHGCA